MELGSEIGRPKHRSGGEVHIRQEVFTSQPCAQNRTPCDGNKWNQAVHVSGSVTMATWVPRNSPITAAAMEERIHELRRGTGEYIFPETAPGALPEMDCFNPQTCGCLEYGRKRAFFSRLRAGETGHRNALGQWSGYSIRIGRCAPSVQCLQVFYYRRIICGSVWEPQWLNDDLSWLDALDPESYSLPQGTRYALRCLDPDCANFYRHPEVPPPPYTMDATGHHTPSSETGTRRAFLHNVHVAAVNAQEPKISSDYADVHSSALPTSFYITHSFSDLNMRAKNRVKKPTPLTSIFTYCGVGVAGCPLKAGFSVMPAASDQLRELISAA
ncbi:hypothetical protein B0T16DRAFT_388274 [Cercophora newfieldiana]|uniref:Uncharacterized protein n=1 Tax=Cercophora newfieldiana TaxID=92897 RepID=A0AA40CWE6_9PEZI|nr:hypothetical protein B0T16DRAFT_388274 [Cercophora newfieldiana]